MHRRRVREVVLDRSDGTDVDMDELAKLRKQVAALEADLRAMARAMPSESQDDEARGRAMKDTMWKCTKCNSLLAFYDEAAVRGLLYGVAYIDRASAIGSCPEGVA